MLQVTQIGYRSSSPRLLKFRFYVKENGWALLTETTLVASEGILFIGISSCTIFNCRSYSLASVLYAKKHIYIFYVFPLCKKFWDVGFPLCCWDREKSHSAVRDLHPPAWPPLQTAPWRSHGGWGSDPDKADGTFGKLCFLWACESKD